MNGDRDTLDRHERFVIASVVVVVLAFFLSAFMESNRSIEHTAAHSYGQNAQVPLD